MTVEHRSSKAPHWERPEQASAYGKRALTGEIVRLRAAEDDDLDTLAAWYRDPEYTVLQSTVYQITSQAETREHMRKWFDNTAATGGGNFVIETLADSTVVGAVNIWGGSLPLRTATLAIQVGGDFVGRGFGTDALRIAVDFSFRELGLNRLQLNVAAFNPRAIRAYEKAGFVVEGRRRQATFHDGCFHDELIMAILFEDWAARGA
ncbi:GNAT family protein [Gryllotalpicola kribbensis]|jgi:RimJ/RimL family protein N-acetyltransferase|uniref:GNAT family protein n=1 Tax=Gryllotalpicola kribbensis TaxID=993084 RepID=A0ABP8AL38_9MICO